MSTTRLAPALVALALLATPALAGPSGDAPVASDPVFVALQTDGQSVTGRIRQIGPKGEFTLVTADGPDQVLPLESLVKLTREGVVTSLVPEASVILFPEGDRLYRTAIGAANEATLDVRSFSLGQLAVPLESLLGLVLALPSDADALDTLLARVRDEPRASEALWLGNGDKLTGGFLGLTDRQVEFQSGKDAIKLDRNGVEALGFDPALVAYPRPKGGFLELTFLDGSRLGVSAPRLEAGHILGTTRFGVAIKAPLAELARIHARTENLIYLTERTPAGDQYVPYIGPPRPYRRDVNVEGRPFRLSGQDYDRGLGCQSRTLLAYRLKPGDKRFQATVGLDDRAGPLGSAVFRVLVDKEERFASPPLSARDVPVTIDLDISSAKALFLITEFGQRGGVRDLADWVEARILR